MYAAHKMATPLWLKCNFSLSLVEYSVHLLGTTPTIIHTLNPINAKATFVQSARTPAKPSHVNIHWIALAEYSQMSTHVLGFQ